MKMKKEINYFDAVREISDSISDEDKNQIDSQGTGIHGPDNDSRFWSTANVRFGMIPNIGTL